MFRAWRSLSLVPANFHIRQQQSILSVRCLSDSVLGHGWKFARTTIERSVIMTLFTNVAVEFQRKCFLIEQETVKGANGICYFGCWWVPIA